MTVPNYISLDADGNQQDIFAINSSAGSFDADKIISTGPDGKIDSSFLSNAGVVPNPVITGSTKTKITYDAKGLVTSGVDATTSDITDSLDKRYCTDAQKTIIGNTSGTNTGDQTLSGLGGIPLTRKITSTIDLSVDRNLTYSDVGADQAGAAAAITPTTLNLVIGEDVLAYRTFGSAANSNTTDFAPASHSQVISTISDSTTVGQNLVKLANPDTITFPRINATNTVDALSAADFRDAIDVDVAGEAVATLAPDIKHSKWSLCTGIITGGQISINSSDHTKLDIAAGTSLYVDNSNPNSPIVETLTWSNQTITPAIGGQGLDVLMLVWVGIYRSAPNIGSPVFSTGFSETDRRTISVLGRLWSNGVTTTLSQVGNYQSPAWGWSKTFEDFCVALGGALNVSGNVFSAYSGALQLQKSEGQSFRLDGNSGVNKNSPNLISDIQRVPQTQYIYWAAAGDSYRNQFSSTLDPGHYDLNGTRTVVTDGKWTIQRLYYFAGSGLCVVTYGQALYDSLDVAKSAVNTENVIFTSTAQSMFYGAVLRGWCCIQKECVDTDPTAGTCFVLQASQFLAGGASGGGASVSNHSLLSHLDFASSGHTGFAPINTPQFIGTITRIGLGTPAILPGNAEELWDTVAGTFQTNVQNLSNDESASTDIVVTADNGSDTENFFDQGINSSEYNNVDYSSGVANDSYSLAKGGDLGIITGTPGKVVKFFTGGTTIDKLRATISDTGLSVVGTVSASNLSGTNTGDKSLSDLGGVPSTRKITASLDLSVDHNLTYSDVGADPAGAAAAITLSGLSGVPTSRTIAGHALTGDVTISASDVGADPAGSAAAITLSGLGGVAANTSITGATKTKVTYDMKGLVTSGTDATTADIADSSDKRYCTDAQKTIIGNTSGTNTGDQTLSGLGGVPSTRKITTSLDLSSDRNLTYSDVGADPAGSAIAFAIALG